MCNVQKSIGLVVGNKVSKESVDNVGDHFSMMAAHRGCWGYSLQFTDTHKEIRGTDGRLSHKITH